MDREIDALGRALRDAAARWGLPIRVNGEGDGVLAVTLGRAGDGGVRLLRHPLPCEGGRTTLNHPATLDGLPTRGTLHWMETWIGGELRATLDHQRRIEEAGLPPDGLLAVRTIANPVAIDVLARAGVDVRRETAAAAWMHDQEGLMAIVDLGHGEVRLIRHAHVLRVRADSLEGPVPRVEDLPCGRDAEIAFEPPSLPPDAALAACAGRPLRDLVDVGSDAPIAHARSQDRSLVIRYRRPAVMLA